MKQLYLRSDFSRSVLTLISGKVIAQAIPIVTAPILTRIYAPESLGIFGLYMATVALVSVGATGSYEHAIVIANKDEEAVNVVLLTVLITIGVSLVVLFGGVFFNETIVGFLDSPEISFWLYFVPLGVISVSIFQILTFWALRKEHYGRIANTNVARTLINSALNLGLGFAGVGVSGLIIGQLVGQVVAAAMLGWWLWQEDKGKSEYISWERIGEQAWKYRDFPKYNLFHAFLDGFRENGLVFLLTYFFNANVLGFYVLSLRVLRTPLNIIGSSIAQVFYQNIAQARNAGQDLWPHLKRMLLRLTLISLPVFLGLAALGPEVFAFVFGDQWRMAGEYSQILSPWLALNFISSPISVIPMVLMKQKSFLFVGLGYNLLVFLIFGLGAAQTNRIELTLLWVSISASVYLLGMIIWASKLTKASELPQSILEQR